MNLLMTTMKKITHCRGLAWSAVPVVCVMTLYTPPVNALAIDNMVLISGQNPTGDQFTLTGNDNSAVFVRTQVTRLHVKENQVTEEPFLRENLMKWTITVNPALFILDPGESRQVSLSPITTPASREADEVYAVSFIPQAAKKTEKGNLMDMQIGFQTYYIVPATTAKMDYTLRYQPTTGKLTLVNKGNTVMLAELDRCKPGEKIDPKQSCTTTFMAIAGRTKEYEVPQWLRGADMTVEVLNHDKSYRQKTRPEIVR